MSITELELTFYILLLLAHKFKSIGINFSLFFFFKCSMTLLLDGGKLFFIDGNLIIGVFEEKENSENGWSCGVMPDILCRWQIIDMTSFIEEIKMFIWKRLVWDAGILFKGLSPNNVTFTVLSPNNTSFWRFVTKFKINNQTVKKTKTGLWLHNRPNSTNYSCLA